MAVIHGVITGITAQYANPSGFGIRKEYLVTVDFPAHTASTDTIDIPLVGAAIAAQTRNGKTNTLRGGLNGAAGKDTAGVAVYTGALAVSSDTLTGDITNAAGASLTSAACFGVVVSVTVDES